MGFQNGRHNDPRERRKNFKVIETDKKALKRKKRKKNLIFTAVVFLLLCGVLYFFYGEHVKKFVSEISFFSDAASDETSEKVTEISIEGGGKATFIGYGKEYLYVTKDGVKYFDSSKNQKWNYTYTMISPVTVNNGNYTAVAEAQGRTIKMYNQTGEVYSVETDGDIFRLSVSQTGGAAAIVKDSSGYRILVYNELGRLVMERFEQDEGLYPIAAGLSSDNRILAVSYLDTTGIEMVSKFLLFYTSREDSINTESGEFFASFEKEDCVLPTISYMSGGSFTVIGDNIVFSVSDSGKEMWSKQILNEIDETSFGGGKYTVLALGKEFAGESSENSNVVEIINSSGRIVGKYEMEVPITYLKAYTSGIVAGGNRKFVCLDYYGRKKWEYTATFDVKDVILMENANNIILVGYNMAEFIKMN